MAREKAYAFERDDANDLLRMLRDWRNNKRIERPKPYLPKNRGQPVLNWVKTTSATLTSGRYPGQWLIQQDDNSFTAQGSPGDIWILAPNGETLILGDVYLGRLSRVLSTGVPVYTVDGGIAAIISPTAFDGCRAYKSSGGGNQTISNSTDTIVTFDSEHWDTNSYHSTSSNTGRLTVPSSPSTGRYMLSGNIKWGSGLTGIRRLQLLRSGSAVTTWFWDPSHGNDFDMNFCHVDDLAPGNYFECQVRQSSGTDKAVLSASYFSVHRIR